MPSPVFISYRRADTQHVTARLFSRLAPRYLAEADIFMDVAAIGAGADFMSALEWQLKSCKVALVMIGPQWLAADAQGVRRIDNANDVVRNEIAAVLARPDITVIPVLVDGARMPATAELPEPLRPLAVRNAVRLTHENFASDVDALAAKVLKPLDRSLDLEQDILKLLFSFKGTIGRKQFWIAFAAIVAIQVSLGLAISLAFGIPLGQSVTNSTSLPPQVKILETIANFWWWWPGLAIAWKRIRDLGHGWELFAPFLLVAVATIGFDLLGLRTPTLYASTISITFLALLGTLRGTRFIAHDA